MSSVNRMSSILNKLSEAQVRSLLKRVEKTDPLVLRDLAVTYGIRKDTIHRTFIGKGRKLVKNLKYTHCLQRVLKNVIVARGIFTAC